MNDVLIAMGTCNKFSYAEKAVISAILNQSYQQFDFLIVDNSADSLYSSQLKIKYPRASVTHLNRPAIFRDALGQVRNSINAYALSHSYNYLFLVDADMVIEPDTLQKLLSHKVDFVTAVIGYMHDQFNRTTVYIEDKTRPGKLPGQPALKAIKYDELDDLPKLKEIASCGLSCCLLKTNILIGMGFYISHKEMAFLEDRVFCRDIKQKGVRIFLDPSIRPTHLHIIMQERNIRLNR